MVSDAFINGTRGKINQDFMSLWEAQNKVEFLETYV